MIDRDRLPDPVDYYESQGLQLVGKGKWRSCGCPFHGSRNSLRINTSSGAFVCMAACGARGGDLIDFHQALHGGGFVEACKHLDCWIDNQRDPARPSRRPLPFPTRDALEVLAEDAFLIALSGLHAHRYAALVEEACWALSQPEPDLDHVAALLGEANAALSKADRTALVDSACRVHAVAMKVLDHER